jgi:hypothetical protein
MGRSWVGARGNGTYLSQHGGEDAGKYLKRNGGG